MEMENITGKITDLALQYGPQLVFAIVTLIGGLWIIKIVVNVSNKGMDSSKMEASLQKFLASLVSMLLKALLLISVASMIGIQTTSFVAIIAAAGLAVGLALQGSLANFAGGVLILLFKPYKVGDVIDAATHVEGEIVHQFVAGAGIREVVAVRVFGADTVGA